jgi:serine/threonine protein kinase
MGAKCPQCNTDNPSDSKFCKECATPLPPSEEISAPTETLEAPKEELTTGSTFAGRYQILEKLGRGGMGIICKAEDTKLKRSVALKVLPPELTQDGEARQRFVLEAQTAAILSHPNICTIHEIDEEQGKSFISVEYVKGQSLKERIGQSPQGIDEVLDIAIQVAEGPEEAYRATV